MYYLGPEHCFSFEIETTFSGAAPNQMLHQGGCQNGDVPFLFWGLNGVAVVPLIAKKIVDMW
jgi:hypothetical protein